MKKNFVYILKCNDHTLYTGWTTDLDKRISSHNRGKGAKYTRARLPVQLIYYETFEERSSAMKREYEIKHLSRRDKEDLINQYKMLNNQ